MVIINNISSHSATDEHRRCAQPRRCTKIWEHPGSLKRRKRVPRTCKQEAGDRRGVQLLGAGDVIAVQEVVQQVDGQVPGRGAELAVAAQQGQDVHKEPAALQER